MKFFVVLLALCASASNGANALQVRQVEWHGHQVLLATGDVEAGDAVRIAAALAPLKPLPHGLPVILLDSNGGSVAEALKISKLLEYMPAHTVVPTGGRCASACASIIFIAGTNRTVEEGGLLGQHSCSVGGRRDQECNDIIAQHAVTKGVAHGNIAAFTTYAAPDRIIWFEREQADCYGLTYYPYSAESQFDKFPDPCFFKTLKGDYPPAQSAWRVDFKADGYTAFLRPAADHLRELELNVFCDEDVPGVLFLSMDIAGPPVRIREAIESVSLIADPILHTDIAYTVSQASDDHSRVTVQVQKDEVPAFLTKSSALSFSLSVKQPYQPIRANTFLAESRKALLFAANHCVNRQKAHD